MLDRQSFGDLCLAVLIALPVAIFAHQQTASQSGVAGTAKVHVAGADRLVSSGRISLLG